MKNARHTLIFAVALGITCSLLLVGADRFTRPYRDANERGEQVRNFLAALEVPVADDLGIDELLAVFDANVRVETNGLFVAHVYQPAGTSKREAVAIPFSGAGVWGPIEGVLALEADMVTIRGIRFYRQEETPGLGGEIAADWFLQQFQGKQIVSATGEPGFFVRKDASDESPNAVDAITGATMTSSRVEAMLNGLATALHSGDQRP